MSDLTLYAQRGITWIEGLLPSIVRAAMVQTRKVQWRGTFVYGDSISKGSAVVYTSQVFLALRDSKDSIPKSNSPDWFMLVDLRVMELSKEKFNPPGIALPPVDKSTSTRAMASTVARYLLDRAYGKALNEPISGTHQWRGIFNSKSQYASGEIVAFHTAVYIATTGKGVPSAGSGWEPLHVTGAVGHGKDMTRSDSETGDIRATFVDAHVERDTDGSRSEYTK